jgi:hypothetical protein
MSPPSSDPSAPRAPLKLPVGISDFGKLIRGRYTFVDKSLLIRDLIQEGAEITLITRPRRFGKTLNLSMLQHFFARQVLKQPTQGLFDALAIAREADCMQHQGQYPVIFFSFKDLKETNFTAFTTKLAYALSALYDQHAELLDASGLSLMKREEARAIWLKQASLTELEYALSLLSELLYEKYQKPVIVLIDEYDTPIHSAYLNGYYNEAAGLMRGLLGAVLKDNAYLYRAVVTGILRISRESLFSGLNNLEIHTVLNESYSQYFGFTEPEVEHLLTGSAEQHKEAVRSWYNGYRFGKRVIYNPWSIINCLKQQNQLRPYWVNTSDNSLLKNLMARAEGRFKQQLEDLIQHRPVEQLIDPNLVFGDLQKDTMALWSLLLFSGYLTASDPHYDMQGRVTCQLRIPNLEVLGLYQRHIEEWFSDSMGVSDYRAFLASLVTGRLEEFEARLTDYLRESASFFDASQQHPEKFYHGLVLGLIAGLKETHLIYSNRESGYGRYDVAVLPKDNTPADQRRGILLEFKQVKDSERLKEAAQSALRQIDQQLYQTELERHKVRQVIKIGLAFSGKQMAMAAKSV